MEIQRPPSPTPNSYNISSHHGSSPALPPLPEASTSAGFMGGSHHRRSHSDGSFFGAGLEAEEDLVAAFLDIQKLTRNDDSVCSEFLMDHDGGGGGNGGGSEKGVRLRQRGSGLLEGLGDVNEVKKAISTEKLAEIWAVDPKRVKRQSAARSKERKARYISELERRVQSLQTEATNLSAQLTIYQRDTTGLITENAELKIRLQAMEQQARLCDALNEALQQEVERLKVAAGDRKAPAEAFSSAAELVPYSPLTSPSNLQAMSYNPAAALPIRPVPMLAQLPPLHSSQQAGLPLPCYRPCTPAAPEQNEPLCRLHGHEINSIGLQSPPIAAATDASSTKQLLTP